MRENRSRDFKMLAANGFLLWATEIFSQSISAIWTRIVCLKTPFRGHFLPGLFGFANPCLAEGASVA